MTTNRQLLAVAALSMLAATPLTADEQGVLEWHVIREFEEDSEAAHLRAAVPTRAGFLVLTDGAAPLVKYNHAGRLISRAGRRGMGPSEFRYPTSLGYDSQRDRAFVWDAGRGTVLQVDGGINITSRMVGSLPRTPAVSADYRRRWYGDPGSAVFLGSAFFLPIPIRPVSAPGDLFAYRGYLVTYGDTARLVATSLPEAGSAPWSLRRDLAPIPLFAACGTEGWATYTPSDGMIEWRDAAGRTLGRKTIGRPTVPVTENQRTIAIRHQILLELNSSRDERADAAAKKMAVDAAKDFSSVRPDYVAAACASDGTLWLQHFEEQAPPTFGGSRWSQVSRVDATRQLVLPVGVRVLWRSPEEVLAVQEDELGVQRVVLLRQDR